MSLSLSCARGHISSKTKAESSSAYSTSTPLSDAKFSHGQLQQLNCLYEVFPAVEPENSPANLRFIDPQACILATWASTSIFARQCRRNTVSLRQKSFKILPLLETHAISKPRSLGRSRFLMPEPSSITFIVKSMSLDFGRSALWCCYDNTRQFNVMILLFCQQLLK